MKYITTLNQNNLRIEVRYNDPKDVQKFYDYFQNDSIDEAIKKLKDGIIESQKTLGQLQELTGLAKTEISKFSNKDSMLRQINKINDIIRSKSK